MTTGKTLSIDDRLAQIISGVFHPLLMPFYGLLIIFNAPALYGYLPLQVKRIMFFIILVENILIPVMLITYLKFRNIITTWTMDSRKERIMPLIMTSFFYVFTVYLTYRFHIPFFIKSFIICLAVLAVAVTIISFWYKISIHATAAGALDCACTGTFLKDAGTSYLAHDNCDPCIGTGHVIKVVAWIAHSGRGMVGFPARDLWIRPLPLVFLTIPPMLYREGSCFGP